MSDGTWHDGSFVCMLLEEISEPFDAGQAVELKFRLTPCHGLLGGNLYLRIPAAEAKDYYLGDEYSIRVRLI